MNSSPHRLIIDLRSGIGTDAPPGLGRRDAVPTVVLIGPVTDERVSDYLILGAVVVMAPSKEVLASWQGLEGSPGLLQADGSTATRHTAGSNPHQLELDRRGRRVWYRGVALKLTGLEYEVLAHLLESPGKAWSFHELRCVAWGPGPDFGGDVFVVRSLIQRLRRKLARARVSARIESVRAYGFRFEHGSD